MNQLILDALKQSLAHKEANDCDCESLYGETQLQLREGVVYAVVKTHSINPMTDELPEPAEGVKRFREYINSGHAFYYDCVPLAS